MGREKVWLRGQRGGAEVCRGHKGFKGTEGKTKAGEGEEGEGGLRGTSLGTSQVSPRDH